MVIEVHKSYGLMKLTLRLGLWKVTNGLDFLWWWSYSVLVNVVSEEI